MNLFSINPIGKCDGQVVQARRILGAQVDLDALGPESQGLEENVQVVSARFDSKIEMMLSNSASRAHDFKSQSKLFRWPGKFPLFYAGTT